MGLIHISLIVAALLTSLVAGFVFAFAVVVMPGIARLSDIRFLRTFKALDRVIQDNQPVFIIVWLGSAVAVVASAVIGFWQLGFTERLLTIAAATIYLIGVQIPTAAINVPLNNRLQAQDLESMSDPELAKARKEFEAPWLLWNWIRTFFATFTILLLLIVLLRAGM